MIQAVVGKSGYDLPSARETTDAEVTIQLYHKILDRDPSPQAGQPDYSYTLIRDGVPLITVATSMYNSQEYVLKHGTAKKDVVAQTVTNTKTAVPAYKPSNNLMYAGVGLLGFGLLFSFLKKKRII